MTTMPRPMLDVFRFWKEPTAPFPYLGAMWTIETKRPDRWDHWECTTTAPINLRLAIADSEESLRHDLFQQGVAALRNTQRWYLLQHLESLGFVERVAADSGLRDRV
jgi:hypothetical protein